MLPDFLLVDKPAGPSSYDLVREAKRAFGERRIGHLGTLDPFATGLMVLALGQATRLLPLLQGLPKSYRATALLGMRSTTGDPEGEIAGTGDVIPGRDEVIAALESFRGTIQQVPPAFSAAKIQGRRAYDLARQGEAVELAPRTVTIHAISALRFDPPELELELTCSTGTYVRSLARDLGERLGCGAYLTQLRRTAIGKLRVEDALPMESMLEAGRPAAEILSGLVPLHALRADELGELRHGRAWPAAEGTGDVLLMWDERAVGLATLEGGWARPKAVFLERLPSEE